MQTPSSIVKTGNLPVCLNAIQKAMIKKYAIVLVVVALAALTAASCVRNELNEEFVPQGSGIELTLDTGEMQIYTKAQPDERPGDEDGEFNENRLAGSAQVFFFDPDADENTPARWNRSCAVSSKMLINVTMADLAAIFGHRTPQTGDQATVIVVANYDGETQFNLAEHKYTKKEIKDMAMARADWSQHPQDHFVMLSDEAVITLEDPSSITPAKGTVKMRRRAAKVTFRLTVAEEIAVENYAYSTDTWGNIEVTKSIEIWKPQTEKITVYPQYFIKDGTLGGTPTFTPTNKNDAVLFTGVDNPYKLVETTTMIPRTRKVFRKDGDEYIQDEDGNYLYDEMDVDVPLFVTKYNDGDNNPANDIDGPFYTYPVTWSPGVETEPFLKLIIPWESGKDGRVKYYYYKIPFQVNSLDANHWYEVTLDVQILGGEEELPVPLDAKYHIVDWEVGKEEPTSTVSARYLSVPVKEFTMYNIEDLEIPMISSHPCEIVNITAKKPNYSTNTETWTTILNGVDSDTAADRGFSFEIDGLDAIDFHHDINNEMGADLDCTPYTITLRVRQIDKPDEYYADITIIQYPAIYISARPGGNAFVDGYFGLLSSWPTGWSVTGTPVRSVGWSAYNANTGVVTYTNGGSPQYTPYGRLTSSSSNAITNLTRVTVTSFTPESREYSSYRQVGNTNTINEERNQYIIGDPRVPSGWTSTDLVPYLSNMTSNNTGGASSTNWGEMASQIKVGTPEPNYIAPSFYIVSYCTRPENSRDPYITFEMAQKRCATLQEAGLPAGRWRLPTEAEVLFCRQLQDKGFIPELFTTTNNQGYYSSSGYAYYSVTGQQFRFRWWEYNYTGTGGISVRCVYDVWYWGETALEDTTVYTPQP